MFAIWRYPRTLVLSVPIALLFAMNLIAMASFAATAKTGGRLLSDQSASMKKLVGPKGKYKLFAQGIPLGPHQPTKLRVGFIDSGTSSNHPQLKGLVVAQRSFVAGPVQDEVGHGTLVMLQFLAGWASPPDGNQDYPGLLSAKVTRDGSNLRPLAVLAAFKWLVGQHVSVVNISLGFTRLTPAVSKLCGVIARTKSVLVVAAAGNQGRIKYYPAACGAADIISVGELRNGRRARYSGVGEVYARPRPLERRWFYLAQQGMAAARAGRLDQAAVLFQESLNSRENALALSQLALVDANDGLWKKAAPLLERAIALKPNQPELLQTLGAVYLALGKIDAAIAQLKDALTLNPHNERALLNLARAQNAKGNHVAAYATLRRAQVNDPHDLRVEALRKAISEGTPKR